MQHARVFGLGIVLAAVPAIAWRIEVEYQRRQPKWQYRNGKWHFTLKRDEHVTAAKAAGLNPINFKVTVDSFQQRMDADLAFNRALAQLREEHAMDKVS